MMTSQWISGTITWILLLVVAHQSHGATHFSYMSSQCGRSVEVNTSLVLALTPDSRLGEGRDRDFVSCALDVVVPEGRQVLVHFMQLSISHDKDHPDRLHIWEVTSAGKFHLTPLGGLWGKMERSLMLFEGTAGVDDYLSKGNKLQLDYLGKPSMHTPGFRVLLTAVADMASGGSCPPYWMKCSHVGVCAPPSTRCDRLHNCGKDDRSDEKGCQGVDTVTDLLENYSLAEDIIVRSLLPLLVFILVVISACFGARMYHAHKFSPPKERLEVAYSAKKGGVKIRQPTEELHPSHMIYDPPSYDHVMHPEPPPAYSSLRSLVDAGDVVMSSGEESGASYIDRRNRKSKSKERVHGSKGQGQPLTQLERYRQQQNDQSDSDTEDEEARKRRRRKGGKSKSKGRTKDLHDIEVSLNGRSRSHDSIHGVSPLASPIQKKRSIDSGNPPACSSDAMTSQSASKASLVESVCSGEEHVGGSSKNEKSGSTTTSSDNTSGFIPIHKSPVHKQQSCVVECHTTGDGGKTTPMSTGKAKPASNGKAADGMKTTPPSNGKTVDGGKIVPVSKGKMVDGGKKTPASNGKTVDGGKITPASNEKKGNSSMSDSIDKLKGDQNDNENDTALNSSIDDDLSSEIRGIDAKKNEKMNNDIAMKMNARRKQHMSEYVLENFNDLSEAV